MNKTKFLIVQDLNGALSSEMIAFINARNNSRADLKGVYVDLKERVTYRDLRDAYIGYSPIKGFGTLRLKDTVQYWILPFEGANKLPIIDNAEILSREDYLLIKWDIEEIE
tara:strand:+ start:821 stop:1153 length:333 start_codon:yes stop_codon:yes gene_type:complete